MTMTGYYCVDCDHYNQIPGANGREAYVVTHLKMGHSMFVLSHNPPTIKQWSRFNFIEKIRELADAGLREPKELDDGIPDLLRENMFDEKKQDPELCDHVWEVRYADVLRRLRDMTESHVRFDCKGCDLTRVQGKRDDIDARMKDVEFDMDFEANEFTLTGGKIAVLKEGEVNDEYRQHFKSKSIQINGKVIDGELVYRIPFIP